MTRKLTLADRRSAWMTEVFGSIEPTWTDAEAEAILDRIAAEAPALGRSEKWAASVRWFEDMRTDCDFGAKWIVQQGSVYMAHAL